MSLPWSTNESSWRGVFVAGEQLRLAMGTRSFGVKISEARKRYFCFGCGRDCIHRGDLHAVTANSGRLCLSCVLRYREDDNPLRSSRALDRSVVDALTGSPGVVQKGERT